MSIQFLLDLRTLFFWLFVEFAGPALPESCFHSSRVCQSPLIIFLPRILDMRLERVRKSAPARILCRGEIRGSHTFS